MDRPEFEKVCRRLIGKYFCHPNYYRIDGKPAFMIYDLDTLIRGLGGVAKTRAALDWFRAEATAAGLGGFHLQYTLRKHKGYNVIGVAGDNVDMQKDVVDALGFDGVTHYQFCHFTNIDQDYGAIMQDVQKEWADVDGDFGIPYFPHVSIGWDNNPRFMKFRPGITTGNEPHKFEEALVNACEFADNHPGQAPLITINSWNEWTEASYLGPTTYMVMGIWMPSEGFCADCKMRAHGGSGRTKRERWCSRRVFAQQLTCFPAHNFPYNSLITICRRYS